MKLNVAYPATGCQKLIDIEDEKKMRIFYEKRMAQEVDASPLGDEWKGYVLRITGGNDKQGFPMKQGVLTNQRVRLLLSKGHSCYRPRRDGERRRKSVRGCIVDQNLSVLSVIIVKKGEQELPGLTDKTVPRRLGPKRASKIRKLFNLSKEDDVRKYVIRRPVGKLKEGKKQRERAPKIQRLITPQVLQRKRRRLALKRQRAQKRREQAAEYRQLLALRNKERRRKRSRRSTSSRASISVAKGSAELSKAVKKFAKSAPPTKKPQQKSAATTKGGKGVAGKATTAARPAASKTDKKPVKDQKKAPAPTPAKTTEKKPTEKKPAEKKPATKPPAKGAEKPKAAEKPRAKPKQQSQGQAKPKAGKK